MNILSGGFHALNDTDLKQYAFCQGGFNQFYDERGRIGGCYFAYCHVLGELTLRVQRVPTMTFLSQLRRDEFRQQLRVIGFRAMRDVDVQEGINRGECRGVVDLALSDFSVKGRARDVMFSERPNPIAPSGIDIRHAQQSHQHEYRRFISDVRKHVYACLNPKPKR